MRTKNFAPLKISSATSPPPAVYMMNAAIGLLSKTASLDVLTRFFVHLFDVTTRLRRENA